MKLGQKVIIVNDFYDPSGGLPSSPSSGDTYISLATANGWTINYIYRYDGSSWVEYEPVFGNHISLLSDNKAYRFDGSQWSEFGGSTGQLYHTWTFRWDPSQLVPFGLGEYIFSTKYPMYMDKQYFTIVEEGVGQISDSDWSFQNILGAKLGTVSDLTDSISIYSSALTGSNPVTIYYTEYIEPFEPIFHFVNTNNHPVGGRNSKDHFARPTFPSAPISLSSITHDWGSYIVNWDDHSSERTYAPTQIRLVNGMSYSNVNWRIELYKIGKFKGSAGVGATDGLHNTSSSGPRTGLGVLTPRQVGNNGILDIEDDASQTTSSDTLIGHSYRLRLRDISTNTVSLFSPQEFVCRNKAIYIRSTGGYAFKPAIYFR